MQIFAATTQWKTRSTDDGDVQYWPDNDLAEQFCHYAGRIWETKKKLEEIRGMGIRVEYRGGSPMPEGRDYDAIMDRTMRRMAAYRPQRQAQPRHVLDYA